MDVHSFIGQHTDIVYPTLADYQAYMHRVVPFGYNIHYSVCKLTYIVVYTGKLLCDCFFFRFGIWLSPLTPEDNQAGDDCESWTSDSPDVSGSGRLRRQEQSALQYSIPCNNDMAVLCLQLTHRFS